MKHKHLTLINICLSYFSVVHPSALYSTDKLYVKNIIMKNTYTYNQVFYHYLKYQSKLAVKNNIIKNLIKYMVKYHGIYFYIYKFE